MMDLLFHDWRSAGNPARCIRPGLRGFRQRSPTPCCADIHQPSAAPVAPDPPTPTVAKSMPRRAASLAATTVPLSVCAWVARTARSRPLIALLAWLFLGGLLSAAE